MEHQKHDFSQFKRKIMTSRTPLGDQSYRRYPSRSASVENDFTLDQIKVIIREGTPENLRELSRYYYRVNGIYRNAVELRTNLYLYHTMIVPIFNDTKKIAKDKLMKNYLKACDFVDKLNVPVSFAAVSRNILMTGITYGILREDEGGVTLQELPVAYCRNRFKDSNNLPIVEFNLNYFNKISDEELREEAVRGYPKLIELAWRKYSKGKLKDWWIEIPPSIGGFCFFYGDQTPPLISSIPSLYKLEEAIEREAKRDENELYKLLIQRMPIDSDGELVFQMDEIGELHESVANMIQDIDTLDVLTTLGEVSLESIQDSSAASQSSDRIEKYKTNAFDALGMTSNIFNSDGSASIPYSIKKEEAIMGNLMNQYSAWIEYQINQRFIGANFRFDFSILPITIYNRDEMEAKYFQGAQYGYSKLYAGVALGIKQNEQLSLIAFENDYLNMSEKMVPLQSTYTSSGAPEKSSEKNSEEEENDSKTVQSNNTNIEEDSSDGGRPEKSLDSKSEKTVKNIEAK